VKAGIATIALRRYDVFHALDLAAEAGFEGIEIWGKPPHTPEEFDEEFERGVRRRIKENGLRVSMFGSYVNAASADWQQKAADALATAKILKAPIIRVWAGNREPREADEDLWMQVTRCLHEFALQAADEGVSLAMEMHKGTLAATPEGVCRMIEQAGAPGIKLNYQVIDPLEPDLERAIGMVGEFVVNVHAQNYRPTRREEGGVELCLIEEGIIDYDRVLTLLAGHGFRGFVEVEFLKGEKDSEHTMLDSLKRDAAYLKSLVAKHAASGGVGERAAV